jgi:hypothetical protein
MIDPKVGDRVQAYNKDGDPLDGVIVSILPPKKERTNEYWSLSDKKRLDMTAHATIKWDAGGETDEPVDSIDPEDSELERQFRVEAASVIKKIDKKLAIASKALDEAVELSEKHGIPFSTSVSPLSQSYFPTTFSEKFGDIETDLVDSITGASTEYPEDGGWEHSAVC